MRGIALAGALACLCVVSAATATDAGSPRERLVKAVQLQAFFHASHPWQVRIYQPDAVDAYMGDVPVRVCLVGMLGAPRPYKICKPLYGGALVDGKAFPLQTLRDVSMEVLAGPAGTRRPALVVKATFTRGGPGWLQGIYVWTYDRTLGIFQETFHSIVGGAGQQEFVKKGPLAGAFVKVDQVYEGDEANMASPVRYEMSVYEPVPLGYVKVLSFLTKKRYPSNHGGGGLPDAIATLTPLMRRMLKTVYPEGVSGLQR